VLVDEHAVVQPPQWDGSVCVSTQVPEQLVLLGDPHEHVPDWQVDPEPFMVTQFTPHVPQLFPSVLRLASQPSAWALPLQFP